MNRFFYAILGTFLLSLSFQAIGQTLNLNQFKVEDGLPQSCIYTLTQDFSGSIWIGTMDGVSRYDGLKFENFSVKDSLAEHRVTASCVDKGGAIWVGHWQGGISKYNPITKKFHRVKTGSISVLKSIQAIQIGNNGEILFSTNGQGIIRYQPSKEELLHGTDTESGNFSLLNRSNGLPSEFCNGAFWDNQKRKLFVAR